MRQRLLLSSPLSHQLSEALARGSSLPSYRLGHPNPKTRLLSRLATPFPLKPFGTPNVHPLPLLLPQSPRNSVHYLLPSFATIMGPFLHHIPHLHCLPTDWVRMFFLLPVLLRHHLPGTTLLNPSAAPSTYNLISYNICRTRRHLC